LFGPANTIG